MKEPESCPRTRHGNAASRIPLEFGGPWPGKGSPVIMELLSLAKPTVDVVAVVHYQPDSSNTRVPT